MLKSHVMREFKPVTVLVLLLVSQASSGQDLWQGTRAGMSPSEVLEVLPMASEVPVDQRQINRDGSGTLLQLKSTVFLGVLVVMPWPLQAQRR